MTPLGWITLVGVLLVLAILTDDWLARRHRKPLSHMKPDPKTIKDSLGIRKIDIPKNTPPSNDSGPNRS